MSKNKKIIAIILVLLFAGIMAAYAELLGEE